MKLEKEFFGFYLYAFILPLPLPLWVSSFALGILFLNCFMFINRKPQFDFLSITFLLFFLSDCFSLILSGRNIIENTVVNDVKIICAILPFAVYNVRLDLNKLRSAIFPVFVIGVLCYILYCCMYYGYFIYSHPRYTVQIDNYLFWAIEYRFPGTYHRTYIGTYIVFSSIITNLAFFKAAIISRKIIIGIFFIVQMAGIFFLGSKLTMVLFIIFNGILLLYSYKNLILPFIFCSGVGFYIIKDWLFVTLIKSVNDRLVFYKEAIEIIADNFLFGIGEKRISEYTVLIKNEETVLIPHNVFLKEALSNGAVGLAILVLLIGYIKYRAMKEGDLILTCLVALLLSVSLIEDFIYLQRGLFFFVFFIVVLLNFNRKIYLSKLVLMRKL